MSSVRRTTPLLVMLTASSLSLAASGCDSNGEATNEPTGSDGAAAGGAGGVGAGRGGGGAIAGGSPGGGTSGGAGGAGSGGIPGSGGAGGADFSYTPPPFEGAGGDCVDETAAADPLPLDIYFMLDRSGSMGGDCNVSYPNAPTTNSKWCYAINAIAGYAQDASSNGNRAAIEYFSGSNNCNGGYETPAVGLVDLTAQAGTLITSLDGQSSGGSTPTRPAMVGLADFTAANKVQGRTMIGVLITDGDPTSCSPFDDTTLANIAQNHFNAEGIHTFVVGMQGATFSRLETWASYVGALSHDDTNDSCGNCNNCTCHHYNVGNGDPAVFIAALQQIQYAVLGCTYQIPAPSMGVLDPDLVTVEYLPGGMPPAQPLSRVQDVAACAGDGWYYDDNANPTQVLLCPTTCTTVQSDPDAEINFSIACQGS